MTLGDAVTTAARLQQAARAGQILVGRTTYRATEHAFAYEPLPPLKLKGKQDRVAAWACVGRRAAEAGPPGRHAGRSPLVGRTAEVEALAQRLSALRGGEGGVVIVAGEAGVGKTRLLAETRAAAGERGLRRLEAGTASFGETAAYLPFRTLLAELAGIGGADDDAAALRKLTSAAAGTMPAEAAAEAAPYLATLLALDLPEELAAPLRHLDGEGIGLQVFRAVRRLFEGLARAQPLLLVFEDWHWADESSAGLLAHLVPLCDSVPLLVCCSTRSERGHVADLRRRAAELGLGPRTLDLRLSPLPAADARELIANLAGGLAVPARLHERILERTEGNPFFIEEVVSSLADAGDVEIPDTLRGALIARIDRLPAEPREVLTVASVLGRSFAYEHLQRLVEAADLDRALAALVDAELLHEQPAPNGRTFSFRHALTHDVVYESVLLAHRRELHLRVARYLEDAFPDDLDELAGTVAFHYAEAHEWEHAQAYLFRAGDHAATIAASHEALAYYRRAVEAYSRASGEDWRDRQRADLDRKIGEAFFRRGDHERAAEYLEHALACLGFGYPETRARLRARIAGAAARQALHRLVPLPRYRRVVDAPDPWMDELSRILDTLGWIYFFSKPERVVLDSFRQLNEAERRGFRLAMVRASTGLGFVFDAVPVRRLGGTYHRRAVELGAALENRRSVGIAYLGLAHHQRYQLAALADALENYARAAAECRGAGDLRGWMGATLMLAEVTALTGDLDASLAHGRSLLQVGDEAGDNQVCAWAHHALGRTLRLADVPEAEQHLEQGFELARAVPDYQSLVVAGGNLGLVLRDAGKPARARDVLEQTRHVVEERRLRSFAATDLCNALALAALDAAERVAPEARAHELAAAGAACRRLARQVRLDRAAAPAALRLQGTHDWLRGRRRRAERRWRAALELAETIGLPHEVALTRTELDRIPS
jgi:class 3 adenylate cyclase